MKKKLDLTEGNILGTLLKLAIPIMGTSFVQMAYNMTDMMWLGRLDIKGNAVAAAGTAGFLLWFGMSVMLVPKIGAEIGVAQSFGKNNMKEAKGYARTAIQMDVIMTLIYAVIILLFRNQLIGFFDLGDEKVINMAIDYLVIAALGLNFYLINPIFTAILNGSGDSKTPFIINTIGLVTNIFLDPMLIFGIGPFPALGVKGAAIATITAQFIVTMCFIISVKKLEIFTNLNLFKKPDNHYIKHIVKVGLPVAIQSASFSVFSMLIAKRIAHWGPTQMAVQKVGSQIESISWMTAGGFQTALSAFVGQNYGAKKWDRIYKGYFTALGIVSVVGILATCLLVFGARPIFSAFIPGEEAIKYGVVYLKILGISQLFMCIEITTAGAFNGLGKTIPPSVISFVLTGLRVPFAWLLSQEHLLGLNGVWWTISISSILKGIVLTTAFIIFINKHSEIKKMKLERVGA